MKCRSWMVAVLVLCSPLSVFAQSQSGASPPCDPQDAECLIDLSLRQVYRAEAAEKKLEGCQVDLTEAERQRDEAERKAESVRMTRWLAFGVGVTLAIILTSYTVAKTL